MCCARCAQCSSTIRRLLFILPYLLQNVCTFGELSDMHSCYDAAEGSTTKAQCLYSVKYPNRIIPSARVFCRINQRLRNTGTLKPAKSDGRIEKSDPDLKDRILHCIQENPRLSTRITGAQEGVSNSTVRSVSKQENLHPRGFQKVQELRIQDFQERRSFKKWMSWKIQHNSDFSAKIFTDEASFNKSGRFWAGEN